MSGYYNRKLSFILLILIIGSIIGGIIVRSSMLIAEESLQALNFKKIK